MGKLYDLTCTDVDSQILEVESSSKSEDEKFQHPNYEQYIWCGH